MTTPVNPIPDDYPRIIPYLTSDNAAEAIEFYMQVFGATERMRMPAPDGKIAHAELELGDSMIMVADEFPEMNALSPKTVGGSPGTLMVYVPDADATFETATKLGAKIERALENKFYGDRTGSLIDPYGYRWEVASHVEDVPDEEMARRAAEAMGG